MGSEKTVMIVPEDVQKEIENLLKSRFDTPEDFGKGEEYDNFFGLRGLLHPRDLTYLAYILEQRFGMKEYDDSRFYSLSGLSEIIAELIKAQPKQEVNP